MSGDTTPNAIQRLRAMMRDFPNGVPDEDCAEWLHENAAAVETLYQAALHVIDPLGNGEIIGEWVGSELAAAVRQVEA